MIMQIFKISSIVTAVLIIAACHSTKKTETTAVATPAPATTETPTAPVSEAVKSKNGIFAPGQDQVNAIQMKHPGATLASLTEGYTLYTGTCTRCHGTKSIYRISEDKWPAIINDMSNEAKLTATEKDALTKYIFAIKSTQPAGK